ncbi:mechanosensitive ion channel domain-containing protein [Taklimakanibacter lacteus]|uniref:mechanosensitive ion channel domain-containing protein n=1 Tax=Taklimakanibacter lacteus TaxID=2268456 RepID=UPI000E65F9A4
MNLRRPVLSVFLAVLLAAFLAVGPAARGQTKPVADPPPEKVDQLIKLLADPSVRDWLARQLPTASPPDATAADQPAPAMEQSMVSSMLDRIKHHVGRITAAWPGLPAKFERTWDILMVEFADRGVAGIALVIAFFVAVGVGLAYLVFRLSRPLRLWIIALPRNTPQGRLKKLGGRALFVVLTIGAFILGSAGTFLMFDWPPLLREIVLAYLTAAIVIWGGRMFARFLLLPPKLQIDHAREVRPLNMTDERAAHWYRWTVALISVFALVGATFTLLPTFGFQVDDLLALAVPADLVLLAIGLMAVWLRPRLEPGEGERSGRVGSTAVSWLLTAYFVALLVIRSSGAFTLFWFTAAAVALPATIVMMHRAVHYLLRPPEAGTDARPIPAVTLAVIDRGIRMALILLAAFLLARVWGLNMRSMETGDPAIMIFLRGLLNAIIIVLAADFGWSIIKALIERKLGGTPASGAGEEHVLDPQQARIRTLLPIIQNITFAVILILAILTILSSIGIQIGPLIAGAGVVGVAVGFGAQTVVKDVISGVFYLLDDAFRVGEYISSGKYMGTVESFSLRSIKLRHHRGPLFTIPFGELGAVQNQSRDWKIDKFNITVGYDTDLDAARKLIKKIGQQLAADPEFAPWVIEPIKMQGVQEFGDYGIVLRMKVTTRPGGAFGMKRKFHVLINKAFRENGIELPLPTVHVQQGEAVEAAVAQDRVAAKKREAAEAAAKDAAE